MNPLLKKSIPLFLAALLCTTAPAQSTESWGSLALKGVGTWAACFGIGLGSTIVHEYGHSMATEILKPGAAHAVLIGVTHTSRIINHLLAYRSFPKPILFPIRFSLKDSLGIIDGISVMKDPKSPWFSAPVELKPWEFATIAAAGPLAGSAFCSAILTAINYCVPKEYFFGKIVTGAIFFHILDNLGQLMSPGDEKIMNDGKQIQQNLGANQSLYNLAVFSTLCYATHRISKI